MNGVSQKTEIEPLNGIPEKRMFWSIISDYDFQTGICELVDNALDLWMAKKPRGQLRIDLCLDPDRQLITIKDNAGGVLHADLRLLIAPGGTRNDPNAEVIGIFGVGSKRAVVALAENITIKTHHPSDRSFQVDIEKDWLESPSWELPAYEIPQIDSGVTIVELSHLRKTFSQDDIEDLQNHLGETYDWFLQIDDCHLVVNETEVRPRGFDTWAFPPGQVPQCALFETELQGHSKLGVEITAGLIRDRDPEADNYGVYVYCNNRLIVKELKVREVGYFVTSEAGVPHPDASLCRAIVRLNGPAKLMPWNSSKTSIMFSHPAFQQIRPTLIQLVSHFSSLSRRLKDDWRGKVLDYTEGQLDRIPPSDAAQGKKLILPPLPRVHRPHFEQLKAKNKTQIEDKPWTLGLIEGVAAVDIIIRQRLQTKNRIALILLDSDFEIALKEFIVHRTDLFPRKQFSDAKIQELFGARHKVVAAVAAKVSIPKRLLEKTEHYYGLRNKLIHERATVGITDSDVNNYRSTVEEILNLLFDLSF